MAAWSHKKPAHVMTWGTLAALGESMRPFQKSGKIKMKQLTFWAGDKDLRSARARRLAVQLDSTYRDLFGSKFESGVKKTTAIVTMTGTLLVGDNTINAFADSNDELYRFLGEGDQ